MSEPLVSVCLITYNHVKYIRETIESVLMQEVDFSWGLIIADDFSTDGTREIILEYKENLPEFINLILQEKNVGGAQNFADLMSESSSKYIAYLDGDDYWIDQHKLQKQVDLLEQNPDKVICFHSAEIVDEQGQFINRFPQLSIPNIVSLDFYLDRPYPFNIIQLSTAVLRLGIIEERSDWYFRGTIGDWPLCTFYLQRGDAIFIDEMLSAYRLHDKGTWTGRSDAERSAETIQTGELLLLQNGLSPYNRLQIKKTVVFFALRAAFGYSNLSSHRLASKYAQYALKNWTLVPLGRRLDLIKIFLINKYTNLYAVYQVLKDKYQIFTKYIRGLNA